ncbi:MAG: hypothetical protein GWN58_45670, partial [Anaerolineae bacterium]|nr:hypothetical protein [Anaerolineae bacterium]
GAILGVLLSVLMAILAVFWYPFKRLIAKFRKKSPGPAAGGTPAQAERSASDTDDGD